MELSKKIFISLIFASLLSNSSYATNDNLNAEHVKIYFDSSAAEGGDGTYNKPYNSLDSRLWTDNLKPYHSPYNFNSEYSSDFEYSSDSEYYEPNVRYLDTLDLILMKGSFYCQGVAIYTEDDVFLNMLVKPNNLRILSLEASIRDDGLLPNFIPGTAPTIIAKNAINVAGMNLTVSGVNLLSSYQDGVGIYYEPFDAPIYKVNISGVNIGRLNYDNNIYSFKEGIKIECNNHDGFDENTTVNTDIRYANISVVDYGVNLNTDNNKATLNTTIKNANILTDNKNPIIQTARCGSANTLTIGGNVEENVYLNNMLPNPQIYIEGDGNNTRVVTNLYSKVDTMYQKRSNGSHNFVCWEYSDHKGSALLTPSSMCISDNNSVSGVYY